MTAVEWAAVYAFRLQIARGRLDVGTFWHDMRLSSLSSCRTAQWGSAVDAFRFQIVRGRLYVDTSDIVHIGDGQVQWFPHKVRVSGTCPSPFSSMRCSTCCRTFQTSQILARDAARTGDGRVQWFPHRV